MSYESKQYRDDFNQASRDAKWTFWKIFGMIIAVIIIMVVVGYGLGWFSEGAKVVKDEFGPKAALEKYEWFKDQSARIEKAHADITTFEERVKGVDKQYVGYGKDMAKWPPHIQVQYNHAKEIARDDLTAIVSNYNNLVKEYNAASSKFNWVPFKTKSDKPKETMEEYKIPVDL